MRSENQEGRGAGCKGVGWGVGREEREREIELGIGLPGCLHLCAETAVTPVRVMPVP